MVTVASRRRPPDSSLTMPATFAPTDCAEAWTENSSSTNTTADFMGSHSRNVDGEREDLTRWPIRKHKDAIRPAARDSETDVLFRPGIVGVHVGDFRREDKQIGVVKAARRSLPA